MIPERKRNLLKRVEDIASRGPWAHTFEVRQLEDAGVDFHEIAEAAEAGRERLRQSQFKAPDSTSIDTDTQALLDLPAGDLLARRGALLELNALEDPVQEAAPHVAFGRLCQFVAQGYAGMSDQQIANASETPRLMRYLIGAMTEYAAVIDAAGSVKAGERQKALATAFRATGRHGGDRLHQWTTERKINVCGAFSHALQSQLSPQEAGPSEPVVMHVAVERALQEAELVAFGPDTKEGREVDRLQSNRETLKVILTRHGYLWPGATEDERVFGGQGEPS